MSFKFVGNVSLQPVASTTTAKYAPAARELTVVPVPIDTNELSSHSTVNAPVPPVGAAVSTPFEILQVALVLVMLGSIRFGPPMVNGTLLLQPIEFVMSTK
jgi:hypothetical protein